MIDTTRTVMRSIVTGQRLREADEFDKSRAVRAIEAIAQEAFKTGGMVNPLHDRELIFMDAEGNPTVGVELHVWQDAIRLSHIRSFQPGEGHSSYVLGTITQWADELEVPITLHAKPTPTPPGVKGLSKQNLTKWYGRYGFKPWPAYPGSLRREPEHFSAIGEGQAVEDIELYSFMQPSFKGFWSPDTGWVTWKINWPSGSPHHDAVIETHYRHVDPMMTAAIVPRFRPGEMRVKPKAADLWEISVFTSYSMWSEEAVSLIDEATVVTYDSKLYVEDSEGGTFEGTVNEYIAAWDKHQDGAEDEDNEDEPPGYREPGSTFTHDGVVYDLDALLQITRGREVWETPVEDLQWLLDPRRMELVDRPDPERVAKADLDAPILVHEHPEHGSTVVDGLHRLSKAIEQGKDTILAIEVTDDDLKAVRAA